MDFHSIADGEEEAGGLAGGVAGRRVWGHRRRYSSWNHHSIGRSENKSHAGKGKALADVMYTRDET